LLILLATKVTGLCIKYSLEYIFQTEGSF